MLNHSCQENYNNGMGYKWYSSKDKSGSSGPGPSGTNGPGPSGSGDGHDNTGSSTGVIVGIISGVIILFLVCVGSFIIYRRRSQDKSSSTLPTIPIDLEPGSG
ncbi:hypothetical protein DVH05_004635 [Phytophthora capsici]|nr:hypothetical protein DVH05_004635 [Phytophthora capsici]